MNKTVLHFTHQVGMALLLSAWCLFSQARTVVDATGTQVTVPDTVQRPLALSETDLDALLALNLQPVGTTAGRGQQGTPNYLGQQAQRIVLVGGFGAPVIDKIIAAKPDLILAGGLTDPKLLQQLRTLAPTVVTYTLGSDWKTAFRQIAQFTGRNAQANTFFERYQQRIEQLRKHLGPNTNNTISIVRWNPQGPAYMLSDSFASLVIADVGLKRPSTQQEKGIAHSPPLSLEAIHRIDADWLFIGTLSPTGQASESLKTSMQSPVFRQLKAVKNQHMRLVDGSLWTSLGGPLAAMAILNDLEQHMPLRKP
jgi:iron complex transport system substrate-binding protein